MAGSWLAWSHGLQLCGNYNEEDDEQAWTGRARRQWPSAYQGANTLMQSPGLSSKVNKVFLFKLLLLGSSGTCDQLVFLIDGMDMQ